MASSADRLADRSRPRRLVVGILMAGVVVVALAGCAAGANPAAGVGGDRPGFWLGLWHGFIAPIAFLVSLVNHTVGIYEVRNSGAWYDVGYLIGISAFFSGPAGARGRARSRRTRS